jgi:hypothetical protein
VLRDRRTDSESLEEQPPEKAVIEKQARLRAMLADHSSFMRDRLQGFVGRETELTEIRRRIAEKQATGGYVTITGQAGQGKSSVMSRLVQDAGPDTVAHHFIPFSPGPDHQVSLLRDLMARLILKHDLPEIYVAGESRAALRDFFPNLLVEIAKRGQQETIYIDGLDQIDPDANGTRDLSFLPTDPPPGIVFVLSTRPDDTLRPLELRKGLAEYKLPPLTRANFDQALEGRGLHLNPGMVRGVYDSMGGNALYLHLVVEELAAAGAPSRDEIIRRVADDPNNLFSLSIDRFKRTERSWREVIRPVLGLLLATQEPIAPAHLRQIIKVDHSDLRDGLRRLGGLVSEDGEGRRYLYHLKLREYLREDPAHPNKDFVFAADEVAHFHRLLADWCEQGGLAAIWQDTKGDLAEQGRREYARQHYITHIYHTRDWVRLASVLDAGDYGRAKVRHDPSTRSYVQDLDLGCQAAARVDLGLEEGLARLPHLWRYTLLRTSLASRADNYPDEAFPTLVLLGRTQEAIWLAELLTDPSKKALALGRIAEQLQKSEDRAQEARVLLVRAYEVGGQIADEYKKSTILEILLKISKLTNSELATQAEALARALPDGWMRASALASLAGALAAAGQPHATEVFRDAEALARALPDDGMRASALASLAGALARAEQPHATEVFRDAEALARALPDGRMRASALASLAGALARAEQWPQAEALARALPDSQTRAWALANLAGALARAEQWRLAEALVSSISDSRMRASALASLAGALARAEQWPQAEALARALPDGWMRASALASLAGALARAEQPHATEVFRDAEALARALPDGRMRASALRDLADALARAEQWPQAEVLARTLPNNRVQAWALRDLVGALINAEQWPQAEALARALPDDWMRAWALRDLADALARAEQWLQAQALARALPDDDMQASALMRLAGALAAAGQWSLAEAIAHALPDKGMQAKALVDLAGALARAGQWPQAETLARTLSDDRMRASALGNVVAALGKNNQVGWAVRLAQDSLLEAVTRQSALNRLKIAIPLIQMKPELAMAFFEAFEWVDKFLQG